MDVDELLEQLVSDEAAQQATGTVACRTDSDVAQKREQLGAVIAGGQAERYLGRAISLDQIDKLPDSEILKLCARYEMCFGASIAKTLGHYVLAMYSDLAAYYRPKINPSSLTADLESNPLVEHGLSAYSGSLYHRFDLEKIRMMETSDQTAAVENNPQPSEMQSEHRVKNPKKVAAGLKSAEARRAKQKDVAQTQKDVEQRLAQLEALKSHMREAQPEAERSEPPPITVTKEPVARQNSLGRDWFPWILGSLGIAAIAWQVMKPKSPKASSNCRPAASIPPPAVQTSQLKRADPFCME